MDIHITNLKPLPLTTLFFIKLSPSLLYDCMMQGTETDAVTEKCFVSLAAA